MDYKERDETLSLFFPNKNRKNIDFNEIKDLAVKQQIKILLADGIININENQYIATTKAEEIFNIGGFEKYQKRLDDDSERQRENIRASINSAKSTTSLTRIAIGIAFLTLLAIVTQCYIYSKQLDELSAQTMLIKMQLQHKN